MNMIKPTTPDKVRGKLVKFRQGDCLGVEVDGKYLSVLISEKFNKYYDLTLLEYWSEKAPTLEDFQAGKCFGTRFGSWEDLEFATDRRMIDCMYVDSSKGVILVGHLPLIEMLEKASYSYLNDFNGLKDYYFAELPIRVEKTRNAELFPDLAFASQHLLKVADIIRGDCH